MRVFITETTLHAMLMADEQGITSPKDEEIPTEAAVEHFERLTQSCGSHIDVVAVTAVLHRNPAGIVDCLSLYFDHGALGLFVEAMTSNEFEEYIKASTA